MMKVPTEIRQMWTDAYNLLVDVYKDDEKLEQTDEQFFRESARQNQRRIGKA